MILPVGAFILGLFLGSFLNVCIHRIPASESVVWPGSHCPACRTPIRAWDNIPLLSYLVLRGRCRQCQARISPRYPLVELISGLLAVGLLYRFGPTWGYLIYYAWSLALVVITFIDLDHQIIPDRLSLGGIVVGLVLLPWLPVTYQEALIGLALGAGGLIAIIYGYKVLTGKEGMGGGDVKLLGMIGVFLGWQGVVFTIFVASLVGSVVGVPWLAAQKKDMQNPIPFGPFLSLGALVYLYWGQDIIDWYFGFMAWG